MTSGTPGQVVHHGVDPARLGVGVTLWLASEAMFFAALFGSYFVLRGAAAQWPPAGVDLDTVRAGLFTLILVASSATIWMAERRLGTADRATSVRWLALTVGLGVVFLANQVLEWVGLGFTISSHPYGSMYFLLTGFHGLHVLGGLFFLALLTVRLARRPTAGDEKMAMVGGFYWHFVDVVWIVMFSVLFLLR